MLQDEHWRSAPDFRPAGGMIVHVKQESGGEDSAMTDLRGVVTFTGLAPGKLVMWSRPSQRGDEIREKRLSFGGAMAVDTLWLVHKWQGFYR
jgi:hypothetical protein